MVNIRFTLKIYVGFSSRQNHGYLRKEKQSYNKKLYINTIDFNLRTIFPNQIVKKLHSYSYSNFTTKTYLKYQDGNDKPMSCYIGIKNHFNVSY